MKWMEVKKGHALDFQLYCGPGFNWAILTHRFFLSMASYCSSNV